MTDLRDLPQAGRYACVLCDPPWDFKTYSGASSVPTLAADPYATMETGALKDLPVGEITAPDCALFMWIVDAHLEEALALGAAWGFTFKTIAFVWVKSKEGGWVVPGMGYWTRKQTECCLLLTKGAPKRLSKGVQQIIHCTRGAHSAKPEITYERVEALVGGAYLEMFARTTRPGWDAWGLEVGKRDGSLFA